MAWCPPFSHHLSQSCCGYWKKERCFLMWSWARFTESLSACVYKYKESDFGILWLLKLLRTNLQRAHVRGPWWGYELIWCSCSWVPGRSDINIWGIQRDTSIRRSLCLFVSVGLNTALVFVPVSRDSALISAHIFSNFFLAFDMCVTLCAALSFKRSQCGSARHRVSRHKPYPLILFVFTKTDQTWDHTPSMHYMMNYWQPVFYSRRQFL